MTMTNEEKEALNNYMKIYYQEVIKQSHHSIELLMEYKRKEFACVEQIFYNIQKKEITEKLAKKLLEEL